MATYYELSILSADFGYLARDIEMINESEAELGTSYMGARAIKDLLEKTGVVPATLMMCTNFYPMRKWKSDSPHN